MFGGVLALRSSVRGAVAITQDAPCAIMGLAAASVAAGLPAAAGSNEVYVTIVAMISASTLITGGTFYLLGRFRLGNLIRFIPYPVVGGFLAGIGWLLFKGGADVMTGLSLGPSNLAELLDRPLLLKWVPGVGLAGVLLFVSKRFKHYLAMPSTLVCMVALYYLVLAAAGVSVSSAAERGWLLGPFPEGALWKPLSPAVLSGVDWGLIFQQGGAFGTVVLLSTISILLNMSGLELIMRRDVDLNHELRTAGLANGLAGLGGSPSGYPTLSLSALGFKLGADSRLIGLTSAVLCGVCLFLGAGPLSYLPRCLAGALLLFVGLEFLLDWVHKGWSRLPRTDYVLVVLILGVIAVFGFLKGVAAGVVVAVLLFIVRYSRVEVVRMALSGRTLRSKVDRAVPLKWILRRRGDCLQVLFLQGFLFFGTANRLFERVSDLASREDGSRLRFLVFDFRQVTGLDSSAVNSFARMEQLAEARGFMLLLTHLAPGPAAGFEREGLTGGESPWVLVFPNLDRALEWCEERILASEEGAGQELLEAAYEDTMERLRQQEDVENLVRELEGRLENLRLDAGEVLIRQGDPPAGLYFVESGEVTVWLDRGGDAATRLRTCGMGSVVGEMSLYREAEATATVTVSKPAVVHHLSREALEALEEADPGLAARLHRTLARQIADRLADARITVHSLI